MCAAVIAGPSLVQSTVDIERHFVVATGLPPSALHPSKGARLSQVDANDPESIEEGSDAIIAEVSNPDTSDTESQEDPEFAIDDPNNIRYNSNGKLSFSHFSRIAFLGKTASKMYNFVAKLFPSPDPATSDAQHFAQSYNSLKSAQQVFYVLFYDSDNLGTEIQQLFSLAGSLEFTLRDGMALFGFDRFYANLFKTQNSGDELFKLLQEGLEEDVNDFKRTTVEMLEGIEVLRNPHKFLYPRLKVYEEDYTTPGNLDTDNDCIAQGQKMLSVFQNLKHELDDYAQKVVTGVSEMFQARAKVATKLKRMGSIDKMPADTRQEHIEFYRDLRERRLGQTGGAAVASALAVGISLLLSFIH
jgi:hypothetical protein